MCSIHETSEIDLCLRSFIDVYMQTREREKDEGGEEKEIMAAN